MNKFFYDFFVTDNKSGHKTKETYLLNKYPDIHKKVVDFCDNDFLKSKPFKEKVWHFIYEKKTQPKCGECGKDLKFKRSLKEGYGKYCSLTCTNKNKEHIDKVKTTNLEKYGGVSPIHSEVIKNKVKTTNKKKYGVENPFQRVDMVEKGFLNKHGVKHVSQVKGVLEKRKLTNLEKYGVLNNLNQKEVLVKTHETRRENFLKKYERFNFKNHIGDVLTIKCEDCGNNYEIHRNSFRYRTSVNINPCTVCNPIDESASIQEKELQNYVKSLMGDECVLNDRKLITPKELDIFIPNKNMAIEYNGVYWHNELYVEKDYHLKKYLECKTKGVDLIQIFQDEWEGKSDIFKSMLRNRLGLNHNVDRVYARKCKIRILKNKEHREFLNNNHIQGSTGASVKYGLYYNDELVSVMTFGKLRKSLGSKHVDGEWELIRFCNKLNINVIGGASKLFKHFIKEHNPQKIISFSDNRFFSGKMYEVLGFKFDSYTKPSYFYVINGVRHHRFNFRKDILVKDGFDPNKTEHQIMLERGYYRVYDCGNKKWVWSS